MAKFRLSSKQSARGGEERSVGCAEDRALHVSAEDRELVAEHRDLDLRLGPDAIIRPKQAKDAAHDEVEDGSDHDAALSQIRWCRARIGRRSGLFTPRAQVGRGFATPSRLARAAPTDG
jgi:hypothetical protein